MQLANITCDFAGKNIKGKFPCKEKYTRGGGMFCIVYNI
jgi:hypothetical protein